MTVEIVTGDALKLLPGLPGVPPNFVLADPPFNLGKDYGAGVDDAMPPDEYREWLLGLYRACYEAAADNAVLYAFCAGDQIPLARECIEAAGWEYRQTLIWWSRNGGQRKPGRERPWAMLYEAIIYAVKGEGLDRAPFMPHYQAVLEVPRPQSNFRAGRWHVCQKPVRLYLLLLQAHQGIRRVLDPTAGSGSSLVACAELGLDAIGIEIVPESAQLCRDRVAAAEAGLPYAQARQGQGGLFVAQGDSVTSGEPAAAGAASVTPTAGGKDSGVGGGFPGKNRGVGGGSDG